MKSSSIPSHEAHLYTTRAESGLYWSGFCSIVLFAYGLGISIFEESRTAALPLLAIAAVLAAVAGVLYFVHRAERMYLQPGSPDYVGEPMEKTPLPE